MLINWFFSFLDKIDERRKCRVCEELKVALEFERRENKRLLDFILYIEEKENEPPPQMQVKPNIMNWRTQRELLEAEDRKRLQILQEKMNEEIERKKIQSTEELEKELGISDEINKISK